VFPKIVKIQKLSYSHKLINYFL